MTGVLYQLDHVPKPFLIAGMVLGFVLFWPIGLAVLIYLFWSKRMGCSSYANDQTRNGADRWEHKRQHFMERMTRKMSRYGQGASPFTSTGNAAFDTYRSEALRKLENEAVEFNDFLARLRMARDKAEFDQYMTERRKGSQGEGSDDASKDGSENRPDSH
jgi:hypothetical protein